MRPASRTHPALAVVLSRDSGVSAISPQAIALSSGLRPKVNAASL
jgi:hypothetical protein